MDSSFAKGWTLCALVSLVWTGVMPSQCDPPQQGCECSDASSMVCSPADMFPTALPSTIKELIIDDCTDAMLTDNNGNIPSNLNYTNLASLFIRNCQSASYALSILPGAFNNMGSLDKLVLTSNELSIVKVADFQGLTGLTVLDLGNNGLSSLDHDLFTNTRKLETIHLSGNRGLVIETETFQVVSGSLRELNLEGIGISTVPVEVLSILGELTMLDLNRNPLLTIPEGAWDNLGKLERLDLNKCDLQPDSVTSGTFRNLNNLKFLNLGFNQIAAIPDGTFNAFRDSLRTLYIEHNALSTLSGQLLSWSNLDILNITDNPWDCNCDLAWIAELDMIALAGGSTTDAPTCRSPPDVAGQNLHNVTSSLKGCSSGGSSSVIALAITIPIIIICAGFIAYYLFRIIQARRTRGQRKTVRYSEVYRDTVEATNQPPPRPPQPVSEL